MSQETGDRCRSLSETSDNELDPHYSPIITLPEVTVPTNEEDEEVILTLRARLYRFDKNDDIPEWKERGTGELKMLKHGINKTVRIVMRRDKTLKVCANHFVTPMMELKPKPGLDKVFVYKVLGEFSSEEIKTECLAVKFGTVDIANQFKNAFLEAQKFVSKECKLYNGTIDEDDDEDEDDEDGDTEKESDGDDEVKGVRIAVEDKDSKQCENKNLHPDEATEAVTDQLKGLNVTKTNGD